MTDERTIGRLAGILYLIVVVMGVFTLVYEPSQVIVTGGPEAAVNNITVHSSLFRASIAAFLIKQVAFLLLPLALYTLLRSVHHTAAILMAVLAVVSVPIALVSVVNKLDAVNLLTSAQRLTLSPSALQAQVMHALDAYGNGLLVTTLFWGLWLLPFGYLVFRSGFLPKVLGASLILGGLVYVAQVLLAILAPALELPSVMRLPAAVGEIGICLWLLFGSARTRR